MIYRIVLATQGRVLLQQAHQFPLISSIRTGMMMPTDELALRRQRSERALELRAREREAPQRERGAMPRRANVR